jgi:molecular chaperone DnaK
VRIGIDLGPTHACLARVDTDIRPTLIPDHAQADDFHTPSTVHVFTNGAFVGRSAEQLLECEPALPVIRHVSRRLGETEPVHVDESDNAWYAEGVAALLLKKLRFDAEAQGSSSLEGAVIAVPAHFTDAQRQSVLAAAALADVPVLGLVEEPVAVALHHQRTAISRPEVLLVCDFGGGAFDATLLASEPTGLRVLATGGVRDRGARWIDEHIGALVLAQFERALGAAITRGARALLELKRISEEIKLELMAPGRTNVRRQVLVGGQVVEVEIASADVAPAVRDLVDYAEASLAACLKQANLTKAELKTVLLSGGTALIPGVAERVRELIPGAEVVAEGPERAVACGAALRAVQLGAGASPLSPPPELKGVTGDAVGVRTIDPSSGRAVIDTLIKKNMPLPAKAQKTYYTTRARQERMVVDCVRVSQAGEALASLGRIVVEPLSAERPNYGIQVSVAYQEDGAVKLEAYDAQTGVALEQVFGRETDDARRRVATQRALVRSTIVNGVVA